MWVIGKVASKRVVVLTILALLFSFINANTISETGAKAADLSQFDAGNIISDSKFFDGNALSASGVQDFLNSKVPNCTINNGNPSHQAGAPWGSTSIADTCLRDYFQQTPDMAAQPGYCSAYPGSPRENAATIIAKVGKVCNISQKVLLVLLEKEQSLISDSWPTVRQINQATGFACYDNGQPCVVDFAGFFYQVWSAARQFQRYGTGSFTWYPVGQVSNIAYQANAPSCGTKSVYIQNRATAALYYYTPYTPNVAALNAGYGTGDSCSAYGNRNFYQLYVDWFGSTRSYPVTGELGNYYYSNGGTSSFLGESRSDVYCMLNRNGCYQEFQNGAALIWSPTTGAHPIKAAVRTLWGQYGYDSGPLGYPTSAPSNTTNTYTQTFEGGTVTVTNGIATVDTTFPWLSSQLSNQWLGASSGAKYCVLRNTGCYQEFQNGAALIWSPSTGAHPIKAAVRALWGQYGYDSGPLGYPTSAPSNTTNTYTQTFEAGTVTVTNGVATVSSKVIPWQSAILANDWLGPSTGEQQCVLLNSGCYQEFQNGAALIWSSTTGAFALKPSVRSLWGQNGFERGALGYPTSDPSNTTNTYTQTFEGGTVTVTNGAANVSSVVIPWQSGILLNQWLGAISGPKFCELRDSGCYQEFQNGAALIWSSTTGAHPVKASVRSLWGQNGFERGTLGYPTSDPSNTTNTYTQTFEGGTITVTNGIAALTQSSDPWIAATIANSWLGKSIGPKYCVLRNTGCYQEFQNGAALIWSPTTGAHPIKAAVRALWGQYSYDAGPLGYPTSDPSNTTNTYTQTFEGGTITVTNGVARRN